VTRVDGPINLPAGAGPHWVVTFGDGTTLVVGVLLGEVARTDIAARALQPTPIPATRLTMAEARDLAFASVGERAPGPDTNAVMDQWLVPGRAFWCGKVGALERRLFACVDLVDGRIYNQAQADELVAANEELRDAVSAATVALDRATAAYQLVRALGPADRLLGIPLAPPADLERLAAAAGLETALRPDGSAVFGPWREVLSLLADLPATEILLEEDRAALRPVPDDVGPWPHPAVAYPHWPAESRVEVAGHIEMAPEAIAEAMDWIARSLRPADGRPYDRLGALSMCATVRSCTVTVWGSLMGAGEDRYDFQVTTGDPIRLLSTSYQAVPRRMVQEVERIARADRATAALIGSYQTIGAVVWDPEVPSRLVITYERTPPGEAAAPGAAVAATMTMVDRLFVTVDAQAGRVVSTTELLASAPSA
jgi:hypothetical protein